MNCFPDTNTLIHFRNFDEIDWPKILNANQVVLVFCPSVISELDKKKIFEQNINIRNRCKSIISKLEEISGRADYFVRKNVNALFLDKEPNPKWEDLELSKEIIDDRILASMIEYDDKALLITHDFGLSLKARRFNIKTIKLDDNLRIDIQKDKDEVDALKKQLIKYQNKSPKLLLRFKENDKESSCQRFVIKPDKEYNPSIVREEILSLRQSMIIQQTNSAPQNNSFYNIAGLRDLLYPKEEIDRYNHDVEEYLSDLENYYQKLSLYRNFRNHTFSLELFLLNEGTTPAEDIDIDLHFPDGFEMLSNDEMPDEPKRPNEPQKPMTLIERINNFSASFMPSPAGLSYHYRPSIADYKSDTSPTITKTHSYNVNFKIENLKHTFEISLDCLNIYFKNLSNIKSFNFSYKLLAANHPEAFEENLNVIFTEESNENAK